MILVLSATIAKFPWVCLHATLTYLVRKVNPPSPGAKDATEARGRQGADVRPLVRRVAPLSRASAGQTQGSG